MPLEVEQRAVRSGPLMGRAIVALPRGRCDVSAAVRSAQEDVPLDVVVEPVEVDLSTRFDREDIRWKSAQFVTFAEGLLRDPEMQQFVLSVEDALLRLDLRGSRSWYMSPLRYGESTKWPWLFTCNICGAQNRAQGVMPTHEEPSCERCRSNIRYRATVGAVVEALLGENTALPALTPRHDLHGLGIGDWQGYADGFASLFAYTNTHLDSEPQLDLTEPPRKDALAAFDFVVAGDVLEHVAPPAETAMMHLRTMLRPGGVAILTVPFSSWPHHVEHFPELFHWALEGTEDQPVLVNERSDGTVERFTSLCFHGPGRSLEMRVFTESSFVQALLSAGFVDVRFWNRPSARHGVVLTSWPGPIVARAPAD
jgi:SAM-dependent methyltransferase